MTGAPPPAWRGLFGTVRRFAAAIALAAAAAVTGFAWLSTPAAPWWMYPFLFCVVLIVVFRLLRPVARRPDWEDEL